jgi:predicted Zn finger-like uncharacterized protein
MRLVCPNCDAEYEIDDSAIPRDGRDVQCSNCGHAWFQTHPEVEAEREAEADLHEALPGDVSAEDDPAPSGLAPAEGAAEMAVPAKIAPDPGNMARDVEEEAAPEPPVATAAAVPMARTLDETVLAVLREEAEREANARRAEAAQKPAIETQTEMPLTQDPAGLGAAVRRIAKMRGAPDPEPVAAPMPPKSRGQMLPAIEEINSTLRATNNRNSDEDAAIYDTMVEPAAKKGGFRRGFLTLVGLAVVIVVLYLLAPLIKVQVPALAGVVDAYVAIVNAARVALDAGLRSLVGLLQSLASGQTE